VFYGNHQDILEIGASNQTGDEVDLLPMLEQIQANSGELLDTLVANACYCSTANLEAFEE
jgi:hypothetical protein